MSQPSTALAQVLAGYMQRHPLSQRAVAAASGVSRAELSAIAHGHEPTRTTLERLAVGLALSDDEAALLLLVGGFVPKGALGARLVATFTADLRQRRASR